MLTCPKCHAGIPEGMHFCLQCGTSLAPPAARVAPPAAEDRETATVPLKIAATPVLSPRRGAGAERLHSRLRDDPGDVDDEAFKKSFTRQGIPPGAVVCRFCKGPIDLSGDFCEQCGAPVAEAAPPGTVLCKPAPAVPPPPAAPPPIPPPANPAPLQSKQNAPPAAAPLHRPTGLSPNATVAPSLKPAAPAGTPRVTPTRATVPPLPPPAPPSEEPPSGLMGRLKGIFKKD